ncbi:MAG: hypothetical protein IPK82_31125 [Polyangiaceae bacterium]|nr:hypothetical protein [Polyangiaceae bacterium]
MSGSAFGAMRILPYGTGLVLSTLALLTGCGAGSGDEKAAAEKAALDAAATALVEPVGLISAYRPHLAPPDDKVKYAPKNHADLDRAMGAAANEIRHAANAARQAVERAGAAGTKDLETALKGVTAVCMDTQEHEVVAKCATAVTALDSALEKAEAARTAAGASKKIPRLAPDSITEAAKKSLNSFLKAKGSGPAEAAFLAKRADPGALSADVIGACQAAASEAEATQAQFEKAEEPIRLVAVTHKMMLDVQCGKLSAAETLRKDLGDCKKKAKTPECKVVCGKAKTVVDDGIPAATFEPFVKEYAEICKE